MAALLATGAARATVYEVGPGKPYKALPQVTKLLKPGDKVIVEGGVTYAGGVTLGRNGEPGGGAISIVGERVDGKRPVLAGVTAKGEAVLRVLGSHYIIEGFDLTTGGDTRAARCFYSVGDDVTLRDSVVHDTPCTGIAGADASGSLTLDRVEVYHCGNGLYSHQIYVGSGLAQYPQALFRMQYCYVHGGTGGNNVKSRVTLNEIRCNWLEGAAFHELDLVGPDPKSQKVGGNVHCDADVAGNVIVVTPASEGTMVRLGSDGTGASRGRYRFAYNTVIVRSKQAAAFGLFWLKGEVDSVEAWNNVFWSETGPLNLMRLESQPAPALLGDGNWGPPGMTNIPSGWKMAEGMDPGFQNEFANDFRLAVVSPLIGKGVVPPQPGIVPRGIPPARQLAGGKEGVRPAAAARDIGAYPSGVAGAENP